MVQELPRPGYDTSAVRSAGRSPADLNNSQWHDLLHLLEGLSLPAKQASIARAMIPSLQISKDLNFFTSAGYANAGDAAAGAVFENGFSGGPGAIQDKNGRWFQYNFSAGIVRPEWWGGFPDNITDCTEALDRADFYANKYGLYLIRSRGVYISTGSPIRGNSVWLAPYGNSTIRCKPNTKARVIGRAPPPIPAQGSGQEEILIPLVYSFNEETQTAFTDRVGSGLIGGGVHNFRIEGGDIDGNRQNGGRCHGLGIYGSVFNLKDIVYRNCSGVGRWTEYPFGDIPTFHKNAQSQYENQYMLECKYGYFYGGPNDSEFRSDYPYLCDLIDGYHYGAGTGKIEFGHPWSDAPPGPQAKIAYLFDSPGNIVMGAAPEGAKEVQIWCRANHQKLTGIYAFYNQLSQSGDNVVGVRIGDNGTDPDYLPGPRRAANAVSFCDVYGTTQNLNTAIQFRNDGGYHDIRVKGFSTRANPIAMFGQQYLVNGNPTSDILVKIIPVNEVGNPVPPVIATFHQIPDRMDCFGGIRVLSGSLAAGVSEPTAVLDTAGLRYLRETDKAGGVFSESWNSGIFRQTAGIITGSFKNWALNAYGADQILLTSNGPQIYALPWPGDSAAQAAGPGLKQVYFKSDGTLAWRP